MPGYVDCHSREHHYAKHRILSTEAWEAVEYSKEADWQWGWHEEHGHRFIGVGTTRRNKRVFMVLHPDHKDFDCYLPLNQWENWDGPWILVTAFPTN